MSGSETVASGSGLRGTQSEIAFPELCPHSAEASRSCSGVSLELWMQ